MVAAAFMRMSVQPDFEPIIYAVEAVIEGLGDHTLMI
jgi:hypothetical protein